MTEKKKRNSAVELLRIVCMLAIIAQHYVHHGAYTDIDFGAVTANVVYLKMLRMYGYAACIVFALISGYYLIELDTSKRYYRRIFDLILTAVFYSILANAILLLGHYKTYSTSELFEVFFPFFYGNWYVVFYIALLFLIPYLNVALKALDKQDYRRLAITLFVLFIFIQTVFGNVYKTGNLDFMLNGYIMGAYYKLHKESLLIRDPSKALRVFVPCFLIVGLSVPFLDLLGLKTGIDDFIAYDYWMMNSYNVITYIMAIAIFVFAVNKYFYNKFVNILASTVLGVYMIHDGPLKVLIWGVISPNQTYAAAPYLHSLLKILAVFLGCALIDLLRQKTIGRLTMKLSERLGALLDRS